MLDIILLPFLIIYKIFIVLVKTPYYFFLGLKTVLIPKFKKKEVKEKISEEKPENKIVIKSEKDKAKDIKLHRKKEKR